MPNRDARRTDSIGIKTARRKLYEDRFACSLVRIVWSSIK